MPEPRKGRFFCATLIFLLPLPDSEFLEVQTHLDAAAQTFVEANLDLKKRRVDFFTLNQLK